MRRKFISLTGSWSNRNYNRASTEDDVTFVTATQI